VDSSESFRLAKFSALVSVDNVLVTVSVHLYMLLFMFLRCFARYTAIQTINTCVYW